MPPEPSAAERGRRSQQSHTAVVEAWTLAQGDADFPPRLAANQQTAACRTLYGVGGRDILRHNCLGLICSVQCPGSVVIKTFDAIRELRNAGVVVAGGFHSPMERECLDFLLRGEQPVIICPARHPPKRRLPAAWQTALGAGRLHILSPFDERVRRTTKAHARTRNEFVAALSTALLIPHASPGGNAEVIAHQVATRNQPVFTFDDPENGGLLKAGAQPFRVENGEKLLVSG